MNVLYNRAGGFNKRKLGAYVGRIYGEFTPWKPNTAAIKMQWISAG